jgi:Zinc-finger of C2H2 type
VTIIFENYFLWFLYMETLGNKKLAKTSNDFYCEICDYFTSRKSSYLLHLQTQKHNSVSMETDGNKKLAKTCKKNNCDVCNKDFNSRSGLWKHKQSCIKDPDTTTDKEPSLTLSDLTDKQMIIQLLTQNQELQKTIIELTKNGINNYNSINVNSNNKTFNLQVFLNENCKNAMNINEFIDSIQPTLEDLENVGRVGYAEGISNIIINKLNNMEITERPIHCSDVKREALYIKNEDVWTKDTEGNPLLLNAIKRIANKNMKNILEWQNLYPGCTKADSKKNDLYLKIVSNSMCGLTKEESNKNFNKIISKISKKVAISDCKI